MKTEKGTSENGEHGEREKEGETERERERGKESNTMSQRASRMETSRRSTC